MSQISEAKHKKTQFGKSKVVKTVSAPHALSIQTLKPGQMHEIQVKLAQGQRLNDDIRKEIAELGDHKKHALVTKNIKLIKKIQGLDSQLKQLTDLIDVKISQLKDQLDVIPPEVDVWLNHIEANCQQYLKEVKKAKKWLYRGASGPDAFVSKSWLSRQPKDSDPQAQKIFDQMLAQNGFVALRSNSIFTTSDLYHTGEFGDKAYVIFPMDNASSFTYTNEADLVLDSVGDLVDDKMQAAYRREFLSHVNKTIAALKPKVPESLEHLHNILAYSWFDWNNWHQEVTPALKRFLKTKKPHKIPAKFLSPVAYETFVNETSFMKKYQPKQDNLALALKKEYEVYVSGTYYALSVKHFKDYLTTKFKVPVESGHSYW